MAGPRKILCGVLLALAGALSGCGSSDPPQPLLAGGLSEAENHALTQLPQDELVGWALNAGADRLIVLHEKLLASLHASPPPPDAQAQAYRSGLHKLGHLLTGVFHCPEFHAQQIFLDGLDPQRSARLLALLEDLEAAVSDSRMELPEKLQLVDRHCREFTECGFDLGVCQALHFQAYLTLKSGDPRTYLELNEGLRDFAHARGIVTAECNARSNLLMVRLNSGHDPGLIEEIDAALNLALHSRLGRRASRLLIMTGVHYSQSGHYSTAAEYFDQAIATIRECGSHAHALDPLSYKLRMYAIMGCWAQVERLLPQARLLLNEIIATEGQDNFNRMSGVRLRELNGRCLLARGQVEPAHAEYLAAWNEAAQLPYEEGSLVCNYWLTGLLDNRRPDLARGALAAVRRSGCLANLRVQQVRLPFFQARLCFQESRLDSARFYLEKFAAAGLDQPALTDDLLAPYHALRARLLQMEDPAAARAALTEGFRWLLSLLQENEPGPEAYMDLCRYQELRWAAHDLFGDDPVVGYGIELLWRRFLAATDLQGQQPLLKEDEDIVQAAVRLAGATSASVSRAKADHCLYQVRSEGITRWWVADGQITRDGLDVATEDLRAEVGAALGAMAADPGTTEAETDAQLSAGLARLARHLLPPRMFSPGPERSLLLITGDGFLAQIPFAPLNIGEAGAYLPLVALRDVAWVRNPAGARARPPDKNLDLVVADPHLDPATARRFRLGSSLAGAEREIAAVARCCPSARILRGEEATRPAVQAAWTGASLLYFLGHVVHNPEAPYLSWLPLAGPDAGRPVEIRRHGLDIKDILMSDLHGCQVVVLSGCASGAAFVDELTTTPSLGDAFLDAGADASIQSFWRVKDQAALLQPDTIICLWKAGELDLVQAVSEARRQALQGPGGVRHPFGWAAFSLKIQGI